MALNEYLYHDNASMSKVTGVLHLVHIWPEQGLWIHPSGDMLPSCHGSQYVFKAGKWTVVDPGPFLGRAIVWKLNVCPHQNGLDEGPAVIFSMGYFSGREYRPSEVIILMADWSPEKGVKCVGNIWFFPHSSYELLKDKPPGWAVDHAGVIQNME
ncbi:hypothetical protein P692DRAFT_20849793 [Suillus brevipes Sb2]|nr:hypothetical protein P692DRAFT_20849793 [Suillus brevipes Sb2]